MLSYSFAMPPDFSDYEWEVTAKGCFLGACLMVSGKQYRVNFYDVVRLEQEIRSELENGILFLEENLIVVRAVTKLEMEMAIERLVQSGRLVSLIPFDG